MIVMLRLSNLVLRLQVHSGQGSIVKKKEPENNEALLERYFNHELIYKLKQNKII